MIAAIVFMTFIICATVLCGIYIYQRFEKGVDSYELSRRLNNMEKSLRAVDEKAYSRGRQDAEKEQKAMCKTCIHKVEESDITAIEETVKEKTLNEVVKILSTEYVLDILACQDKKIEILAVIRRQIEQLRVKK